MKDYKRWTDKEHKYKGCVDCTYRNCQYCDAIVEYEKEAYNRLCDLEDKIEDGTLIELPYKLGTELHFIVLNMHSGELEIFTTEFWAYVSRYKDEFGGVEFAIEIIDVDFDNDTLIEVCNFLTKAEAEAKLRELKGE